jgi:[FeFe] hydrogenase H-cluster maturation GTPase HydF
MIRSTSKAFRIAIGFFGRRNVGKSSLLNAITRQNVSIVSTVAGTTTDPVEKPMELQPLGPVLFIDTAGVDDLGALGAQRIERTCQVIARTDIAVLVSEAGCWNEFEQGLLNELRARAIPTLIVVNKTDLIIPDAAQLAGFDEEKIAHVEVSAATGEGMDALRAALTMLAPERAAEPAAILRDLVPAGELAVLVTPIDREAPKGRIKQLQVQCIRDLLDGDASCIVVKDAGLKNALDKFRIAPSLVVTDAQVFGTVANVVPDSVPLTAFSILFSRLKGDLVEQTRAVLAVDELVPGDEVLLAEACTHHPIEDDIGRAKIPRWLNQKAGGPLRFTTVQGRDLPADLSPYKLVIHCGACMWTRREMLSRIAACQRQGVPITNYGILIAHVLGILERALEPFPEALTAYHEARRAKTGTTTSMQPLIPIPTLVHA